MLLKFQLKARNTVYRVNLKKYQMKYEDNIDT